MSALHLTPYIFGRNTTMKCKGCDKALIFGNVDERLNTIILYRLCYLMLLLRTEKPVTCEFVHMYVWVVLENANIFFGITLNIDFLKSK